MRLILVVTVLACLAASSGEPQEGKGFARRNILAEREARQEKAEKRALERRPADELRELATVVLEVGATGFEVMASQERVEGVAVEHGRFGTQVLFLAGVERTQSRAKCPPSRAEVVTVAIIRLSTGSYHCTRLP